MSTHKHDDIFIDYQVALVDWLPCEPFYAKVAHFYCRACLETTTKIVKLDIQQTIDGFQLVEIVDD